MRADTTPTHGDGYVPDISLGPVAAEGADQEAGAPDLNLVRRLVPTSRQARRGGPSADTTELAPVATAELPAVPDAAARRLGSPVGQLKQMFRELSPKAIAGPKVPLVVFGLSAMLAGWDDKALDLAMPEIQADFGLSVMGLATIGSVVAVVSMILGLPIGYLIDRVNRVMMVRISAIAANIGDLIQVFAPTSGTLMLGRAFGSVARIPNQSLTYPLLTDYYPSRSRARVISFITLSAMIGGLAALPIVGLMIKHLGWRQSTLLLAILSIGVALLTFLLREPVRGAVDRLEMGATREAAAKEQAPPSFQESMRGAWAIRTLRLQAIGSFVSLLATGPIALMVGLLLAQRFALDPFERALIGEVGIIVGLVALPFASVIADRLIAKRPSTLVALQAALVFLSTGILVAQAFAPNLFMFIVPGLIFSVVAMLLGPAQFTIMSLVTPARYRGLGMQVYTPFLLVSTLLAPVMVGTAEQIGLQNGLLFFVPIILVGGLIQLASAGSVARDIRVARASALAEEESERSRRERQDKVLVIRDLDVAYGDVQILFNVDLDVHAGEIVALVGTNGAGKSTLLKAICGLQQSAAGAIFYDGRDITNVPTHENAQRGVVYMPGGQGVFPQLTVRENLRAAGWTQRKDEQAVAEGVQRVLEMFPRLAERIDTPAGAMSGGEQQMLAVGQAFLMRPKLLMIDELSLGLAPAVVEQLLDAIRDMRADGVTVILVEQSLNVALTVADRAVFMEKGEVHFDGPTEALLDRPDLVRAVFMGGASGGAVTRSRKRTVSVLDDAEVLLSCQDVSVAFGGVQALSDVSLDVAAGEVVGIIGPNGAGKTTLFDIVSGYTAPDAGAVLLGDRDVTTLGPDVRARLGLGRAFQNARLFPPLTVRENIAVAMERRAVKSPLLAAVWAPNVRRGERKLQMRVDGFIELLGLTSYADKFVRELSTGTRRAVEVACQMAAEPKMLLLDEPSSGLAQAETEALGPALLRIVKETGCGMLVIEHDLPLITGISDRLVAMELGQVIATGPPAEVVADPRVLQSYLAASHDVIERSGSRVGAVLTAIDNHAPSDTIHPEEPRS